MSLLKQNITWKGQIDESAMELNAGNNSSKYKIEAI